MSNAQTKIDDIIKNVKDIYAPDKRVEVFNLEYELSDNKITLKGELSNPVIKEKLVNEFKENKYSVIDKIELLPQKKLGDKIYGLIKLSVANIRVKPDNSAELATQALLGTPIKILKQQCGYFYIQTPDNYLGYCDDDAIELKNSAQLDEWIDAKKVIFTDLFGIIKSKPNKVSENISDIVSGGILVLDGGDDQYYKVKFPDDRNGYISKTQTEVYSNWLEKHDFKAENILNTAKLYMGFPYLWGGTSIKGIDCSGFTKTAFFLNGIILPRDASQQVNIGDEIDIKNGYENLMMGDLLFFGRKKTDSTSEKITHVALYIGDGDYIHSSGRVRINSLNKDKAIFNSHRFNTFVRAKRILNTSEMEKLKIINNKYYKRINE